MTVKTRLIPVAVGLLTLLVLLLAVSAAADAAPAVSWNSRAGVAFDRHESGQRLLDYDLLGIGAGWAYDFYVERYPRKQEGLLYTQTIWRPVESPNGIANVTGAAVVNPGAVWFVGNECDHTGQCALTPDQYAQGYHAYYSAIKAVDSTAVILAGGISQPTPIRLRWLDAVLAAYATRYGAPLPADGWHIHMYILPEKCSWGVGIPVGLSDAGDAFDCSYKERHAELAVFKSRLADFRLWMRLNGYQQSPLVISEYGILLGPEHGYHEQRIADYLRDTFAYMATATDTVAGYEADGYRIVQRWAWFSVNYKPFPWSALFDPYNKTLSALGRAYATAVAALTPTPTFVPSATVTPSATPTATATATDVPSATPTATVTPSATPTTALTLDPCKLTPGGCQEPTDEQGGGEPSRLYLPLIR
jgi:hypothetical protein